MSRHRLMLFVLGTAVLVLAACQTSPPRVRRPVSTACFNTLTIDRHLERPDSRQVLDIRPERERNEYLLLARHHIIPYATMRDFYNTVLANDQAAFTRLFNDVIFPAGEHRGVFTSLAALNYGRYVLPALEELTDIYLRVRTLSQVQRVQQVYAWLPFNIYIGPTPDRRDDDERANVFDEAALPVVGEEHHARLRRLYENIVQYINNRNSVSVNAIIGAMADLVHSRYEPFSFDPAQWRVRTRINTFRFRTATYDIVHNEADWRQLRTDDYCNPATRETAVAEVPEHYLLIRSEDHPTECLLREDNNDPFCIMTLDNIRESIKDGTIKLLPTVVDVIKANSTEGNQHPDHGHTLDPRPKLTAAGWIIHLITFGMWP